MAPRPDMLLEGLDALEPELDLRAAFEVIRGLGASERGTYLEKLVVCLLRRSNATAEWNPAAVPGRQTDFTFKLDEAFFIGEAKWLHRPAGQMEMDGLHRRLQLSPPSAIGCFVSKEGFTSDLLDDLRQHRERELVLIDGDEVEAATRGQVGLAGLIRRKRDELRLKGKLLFLSAELAATTGLPPTSYSIVSAQPPFRELPVIASRSERGYDLHFMVDILQFDLLWNYLLLELHPSVWATGGLATILRHLHSRLDLEGDASFNIHQAEASWFGFGAANLLAALQAQASRYQQAAWMKYVHHSESFSFCAHSSLGLVIVRGRQRQGDTEPYEVFVDIVTDGIPLDTSPLQQLARELDRDARKLRIVPIPEEKGSSKEPPMKKVEPVALIRNAKYRELLGPSTPERDVMGLVIRNPFPRRRGSVGAWGGMEHVPCFMKGVLHVAEVADVNRFSYLGARVERFNVLQVARVTLDWDKVLRRGER